MSEHRCTTHREPKFKQLKAENEEFKEAIRKINRISRIGKVWAGTKWKWQGIGPTDQQKIHTVIKALKKEGGA